MFGFFTLMIVAYGISILYLRRSDPWNKKKKNMAGWLLFGFMWPQIRPKIEKDSEHAESIFLGMLIAFMMAAVGFTYLITDGNLSFF